MVVKTVLLLGHRVRVPRYGGTEDRVQRLLTVIGLRLSEEVQEMEHMTCQFQWISLGISPQEPDDIPILHPR